MSSLSPKTFIQVLEGPDYQHATVVALIDAPAVVQAVRVALADFFNTRSALLPESPNAARSRTSYLRRYGKSLKAMAAQVGLAPAVVSTRLRRGWTLRQALKRPAQARRKRAERKRVERKKHEKEAPTAA